MICINVMTRTLRHNLRSRRWREKNPTYLTSGVQQEKQRVRSRNKHLARYGLTAKTWEALFNQQGRCCAICKSSTPKTKSGWHTDHDHTTEQVRGILCNNCNVGLGGAEESIDTLTAMIQYLQEASCQKR